jgi:hypothetical protein
MSSVFCLAVAPLAEGQFSHAHIVHGPKYVEVLVHNEKTAAVVGSREVPYAHSVKTEDCLLLRVPHHFRFRPPEIVCSVTDEACVRLTMCFNSANDVVVVFQKWPPRFARPTEGLGANPRLPVAIG